MNVDEDALLGEPSDEVPKLDPTDKDCRGKKTSNGVFRGYCRATPGRGTDHVGRGRCKHHGGAADNRGRNNGNYQNGAFSKYLRDDLTDGEQQAIDDLVDRLEDPDRVDGVIRELVGDAIAKYKRSGDVRFLREVRQLLGDFVVETTDQLEVEHSGQIDGERTLGEEEKAALREALSPREDT